MLSRKKDQSVIIAGNIRITVVAVSGNVVKLGIDAPKDVSVNREEVEEQKQKERRAA